MANLTAVNVDEFSEWSWQRNPNFLFSANDTVCPLTASEIPRAMMDMPIAFLCTDGKFSVVAVQGLEQGANFFLDADGQWIGNYIPAVYRGYPFVLASNAEDDDQLILCIDKDSGLLLEDGSAEPFFDRSGELSQTVADLLHFLSDVKAGEHTCARICNILLEYDLFKPWELEFELESGTKRIEGLYCIDETALNKLSDASFAELRQAGVVPYVYCQLLSMQRISILTQIAQSKSKDNLAPKTSPLDLYGANLDGNISFDNF